MTTIAVMVLVAVAGASVSAAVPQFSAGRVVGTVSSHDISDCSGIVASRAFPGILYVINDGDDTSIPPRIFALNSTDASVQATFTVVGAQNHDWEDIAIGPCYQSVSMDTCIYVADTGLYSGSTANTIYKMQEPSALTDQSLSVVSTLKYRFVDPESDTLLVDPDGEVYVISKVLGGRGMIAHLPTVDWGQTTPRDVSTGTFLYANTEHHDPVGGDISANGNEVIIKTREDIYYWQVTDGNYTAALTRPGTKLPYHMENYGEAVCWAADGSGYFTLGEGNYERLYFYSRASTGGPPVG